MISLRKPERIQSIPYRKFVRQHPCIVWKCFRVPQVHHVVFEGQGRIGSKVSDFQCVPCCDLHHREFHSTSREQFAVKHGLNFAQIIIDLLACYIVQLQAG
jgi:hypothetical protein